MTKLEQTFHAVIVPVRRNYGPPDRETGKRPVDSFRVDRIVKGRPTTKGNEIAVKLNLSIDSSIFETLVPVVSIELGERDLFVNTKVEINAEAVPEERDPYADVLSDGS